MYKNNHQTILFIEWPSYFNTYEKRNFWNQNIINNMKQLPIFYDPYMSSSCNNNNTSCIMKPFNQFTHIQKQPPNNIIYWMARLFSYTCKRRDIEIIISSALWHIIKIVVVVLRYLYGNILHLQRYNRT